MFSKPNLHLWMLIIQDEDFNKSTSTKFEHWQNTLLYS